MVAADVVELDAVVVEVVEHGQAELVALAVVRLGNWAAEMDTTLLGEAPGEQLH